MFIKSLGASASAYGRKLGVLGWLLLTDYVFLATGLYLDMTGQGQFPWWGWTAIILVAVVVPFVAFHKERLGHLDVVGTLTTENGGLREQLDRLADAKACVMLQHVVVARGQKAQVLSGLPPSPESLCVVLHLYNNSDLTLQYTMESFIISFRSANRQDSQQGPFNPYVLHSRSKTQFYSATVDAVPWSDMSHVELGIKYTLTYDTIPPTRVRQSSRHIVFRSGLPPAEGNFVEEEWFES